MEAVANTLSRESKDALNAILKLHIVVAAQIEESQAKEDLVEVGWAKRTRKDVGKVVAG